MLQPSSSGTLLSRDVALIGGASVVLGSLALGKADGSFRSTPEGWFGKGSKYAGMDKLGHVWYGSTVADFFYERNRQRFNSNRRAAVTASASSFGIMAAVELADGFADTKVGFSYEDVIANAVGAGFSYLRNVQPRVRALVDFRLEYLPRYSASDWSIDTFYADQKYLLAWKLAAMGLSESSPLRFVELHSGYYARGYSSKETDREKRRVGFVGFGINLAEVFGTAASHAQPARRSWEFVLERVQVPFTSLQAGPI